MRIISVILLLTTGCAHWKPVTAKRDGKLIPMEYKITKTEVQVRFK